MGHYDECYDFDDEERTKEEFKELRKEIKQMISNVDNLNNLKQIKFLIKNISQVNDSLRIISNLNTIRINYDS